jgi:hypothetical protein
VMYRVALRKSCSVITGIIHVVLILNAFKRSNVQSYIPGTESPTSENRDGRRPGSQRQRSWAVICGRRSTFLRRVAIRGRASSLHRRR